jgi:hypothetical protein
VPLALARNNPLPIFNAISRPVVDGYDNWGQPTIGDSFDPATDRYLKPATQFPVQPNGFGNATRYNPKMRNFWNMNENISLSKTFPITESVRLDFRGEAFNLFNRVVFNKNNNNLNSLNLGQVTGVQNEPRTMQVALKIYW